MPQHPSRTRAASAGEVIGYVAAATALSTLIAAPLLLGFLPEASTGLIVPLAQLSPLLVALVFFVVHRPGRLRDLLALGWARSGRGIALGLAVLVVLSAAQAAVALATGAQLRPPEEITAATLALLPVLVLQCVFAIGEELGWRGWLASRTTDWSFPVAAATQSVAWVLWHLPVVPLITASASPEFSLAYLLGIASWAPFFLALRRSSGSVWPAVVLHGGINSLRVFLLQSLIDAGGTVNWWAEAAGWVLWLAAAAWLMRRSEL